MSKSLKDVKISDSYPRLVQQIDGIFYDGAGNPIAGITGPQGFHGVQGVQGISGVQGVQGISGPQGFNGPQGFQGINGSSITKFIATTGYPILTSDTSATFTGGIQYIESLQQYDSTDQNVVFTIRFPETLVDGDVFSVGLIDSNGAWRFYGDVFNDSSNVINIYSVPDTQATLITSTGINAGDILSFKVNNTSIHAYKNGVLLSFTDIGNNFVYRARVAASTIASIRNIDMLNLYSAVVGSPGNSANYHIPDAEFGNFLSSTWYFNNLATGGQYSFSENDIVIVRNSGTNLTMTGKVNSYGDAGGGYYQMSITPINTDSGFPGSASVNHINLTGLPPALPTPKYKVFTALLTQSGTSTMTRIGSGSLIKGVSYSFSGAISADYDFSNVGGPAYPDAANPFIASDYLVPTNWSGVELTYDEGAPVATVLENTIGNIWFIYDNVGTYLLKSNDFPFSFNKTYYQITPLILAPLKFSTSIYWSDENNIGIQTSDETGSFANTLLVGTPIEIRVYN